MTRTWACGWLFLVLITSVPARARDLVTDDFYHHPGPEQQLTEFWTAIGSTPDGWVIYVSFLRTNMGVTEGNTGIALSVTSPEGEVTRVKRRHPISEFREDRAAGTIRILDHRIRFDLPKAELHIDLPEVQLHMEFAAWTKGYKYGDGLIEVDRDQGHWMRYWFLVPRATLSGRLKVGEREVALSGDAYLEHTASNRAITLWARRWYVVNLFAPDVTLQFLEGHPLEAHGHLHGKLAYLAVTDRRGVRLATRRPRLRYRKSTDGVEGYQVPTELLLEAETGKGSVSVAIDHAQLHDPYVVLEQLSPMIRRLLTVIIGNPVFFRFRNRYTMKLTLGGKTSEIKGKGLHQVVCLRP